MVLLTALLLQYIQNLALKAGRTNEIFNYLYILLIFQYFVLFSIHNDESEEHWIQSLFDFQKRRNIWITSLSAYAALYIINLAKRQKDAQCGSQQTIDIKWIMNPHSYRIAQHRKYISAIISCYYYCSCFYSSHSKAWFVCRMTIIIAGIHIFFACTIIFQFSHYHHRHHDHDYSDDYYYLYGWCGWRFINLCAFRSDFGFYELLLYYIYIYIIHYYPCL